MEYHHEQTNITLRSENQIRRANRNRYVFEKEFAKRTLANLRFIDAEIEKRHEQGIDDKDIHDVFEVTQLINSFVGMVILPKEKFFNSLRGYNRFLSPEANQLLHNLTNDRRRYYSSYTFEYQGRTVREELNPKNLSRHFRNAIAHNNLEILPQDFTGEGKVTGVVFKDNYYDERFRLELDLKEIRILLEAVCELILSVA
ncbi:MAG: hypothetical protein IJ100_01740 [Lachnospiraceae bacterium]|nr:hypothetical protein [Lachnospiraceae bacterium]